MTIETLLLDFMAKVNDSVNHDGTDAERLKKVREAKRWAEEQYAAISNAQQPGPAQASR